MEMDISAFEFSVDVLTDLTDLLPAEEAEVKAFASDVAAGFSSAVADALDVSPEDLEVTCIYRTNDPAKLDLLTLSTNCAARRQLSEMRALRPLTGRRLESYSFGVELTLVGAAAEAAADLGTAAVAAAFEAADVEIHHGDVVVAAQVREFRNQGDVVVPAEVAAVGPAPATTSPKGGLLSGLLVPIVLLAVRCGYVRKQQLCDGYIRNQQRLCIL